MTTAPSAISGAARRIQRDILEWNESARHFCNIGAHPLESDMFTWHFNVIVGNEVALHGQIKFPQDYPFQPPTVAFFGNVPHRQVARVKNSRQLAGVCLDMLQQGTTGYYQGWSSAYSVVSLFAQMETLLHRLGKNQLSEYWKTFTCDVCNHDGHDVSTFSPRPYFIQEHVEASTNETEMDVWSLLHADEESVIFSFLSQNDLRAMVHVSSSIQRVLYNMKVYHHQSLECFHSRATFGDFLDESRRWKRLMSTKSNNKEQGGEDEKDVEEDGDDNKKLGLERLLFGIGFRAEYWENTDSRTGKMDHVLKDLHICPDVLSLGAFLDGVQYSMWKDFKFQEFMPLYLNDEHGEEALKVVERVIAKFYDSSSEKEEDRGMINGEFNPICALRFLSKLMNTTVVSLMVEITDEGKDNDQPPTVHLFSSLKALQSYMYFYHLLLGFCKKYPRIVRYARRKVNDFVHKPDQRDKKHYPDLGEFLIYLTIVPEMKWTTIGPVLQEEALCRNAKWILKEYPSMITTDKNIHVSCVRLRRSWQVSRVGKRLQMFQYYFLHNVCGVGKTTNKLELDAKLRWLNRCLGQVEERVAVGLQRRCREIFLVDDWMMFFEMIGLPCPSSRRLSHELRQAMVESDRKGYHRFVDTPIGSGQPHEDSELCLCSGEIRSLDTRTNVAGCGEEDENDGEEEDLKEEQRYLDVAFCVDCTGSMSSYLDKVQNKIQEIAAELNEEGNVDVRFAIVGYRDHDREAGDWRPSVTKVSDFGNLEQFRAKVSEYYVGGGSDVEAVADGWYDILGLSWRRFSVKAVIQIADIGCHGLRSEHDECPNGHDPIALARQMLERDITLYNVGCTMRGGDSKAFFQGTAHMTGGLYLKLKNADKLPQVIVESTREGMSLTKIVPIVHELMKEMRREHRFATRDQIAYFVWTELVRRGVSSNKVKCVDIDPKALTETVVAISEAQCLADVQQIFRFPPNGKKNVRKSSSRGQRGRKEEVESVARAVPVVKNSLGATVVFNYTANSSEGVAKKVPEQVRNDVDLEIVMPKVEPIVEAEEKAPIVDDEYPDESMIREQFVVTDGKLITLEQTMRCMNRAEQVGDRLEWMKKGCVYRMAKYTRQETEARYARYKMTFTSKMKKIRCHSFAAGDRVEYHDYKSRCIYSAQVTSIDCENFAIVVRVNGLRGSRTVPMTSKNLTKFGKYLTKQNREEHDVGVVDPRVSPAIRKEAEKEQRERTEVKSSSSVSGPGRGRGFSPFSSSSSRGRGRGRGRGNATKSVQEKSCERPARRERILAPVRLENDGSPPSVWAQSASAVEVISNKPSAPKQIQAPPSPVGIATNVNFCSPLSRLSQSGRSPSPCSLSRCDMVVRSALCVIPPEALWRPIQAIRRVHDKAFKRWMPHVNILYPFVQSSLFVEHAMNLESAFGAAGMQPFTVEFVGLKYFDRKPTPMDPDPKLCVYLDMKIVRGDVRSWDLLMNILGDMYPNYCDERAARWQCKPHLTVAQVARSRVMSLVAELEKNFVPSRFDVNGVCLVSRSGYAAPFEIDHVALFEE